MAISFKSVREKAQHLKVLNKDKTIPLQTEKLRELRPMQRQILSLFVQSKEVTVHDIAEHLGLKSRSSQTLVKKWLEADFIEIINPSRKSRTYGLTHEWEFLITNKQKERLSSLERVKNINKDQSQDIER